MGITKQEMLDLMYDPSLMQKKQLDMLASSVGGEFMISDPTNPFVMLLEATNTTASAALVKCDNIIRKKYPSLAGSKDDLYHHLFEEQLTSIFSVPAEVTVDIYVNVVDLKMSGYRPPNSNYIETTIPKYTKITILDIPLMLLNDIVVKLYDNNETFVEQQLNNENSLAFSDIGSLSSELYNSSDDTPWIRFRTKAKQVDMVTANKTVIASDGFVHTVKIEDKYCFAQVAYKNAASPNYTNLPIAYNDEYIDPLTPTAYITPYYDTILVRIPDVYLNDGQISGVVSINIFTSKGKLYIPINKYTMEDFSVVFGETGNTPSSSSIKNITVLANSVDTIDGGLNNITNLELRNIVVNSVTNTTLPITTQQLERAGDMMGYKIINTTDVITGRLFLALRSLPDIKSSVVFAKQDVFFNTVKLVIDEIKNLPSVYLSSDMCIIKSNTIFKETNGVVTLAKPEQITYLENLSPVKLIEHLETNKYFYNPYYYVINNNETYTNSRVYDLDNPEIDSIRILMKNLTVVPRVNIDKWDISKVKNGFRFLFTLAPNAEFEDLDKHSIRLQMKLPLFGGTSFAYINSKYLIEEGYYEFMLETDMVLDENDMFVLNNGESELFTKKFGLDCDITIYTMSDDVSAMDPTLFLTNEIHNPKGEKLTVFTKELLKVNFGKRLKYIFNKLYNVYNTKKYKTYDHDYPLVHQVDVFNVDPVLGTPYLCNDDEFDHSVNYELKYAKGEPVLDENGEQVYKYRKGDVVLDENGEPIVDQVGGVVRYIDMLLLEYEYFRANSAAYTNYKISTVETLNNYILNDMHDLNSRLLENTELLYKSYKTSKDVHVIINGTYEVIPYMITPEVTLYLSNTSNLTSLELDNYKNIIGGIINRHLDNRVIKLEDIKLDIKNTIGTTVTGVKIENIDPNNSEIITIKDENTKLTLNKILGLNTNSEYVVKYNIKLNIQYLI